MFPLISLMNNTNIMFGLLEEGKFPFRELRPLDIWSMSPDACPVVHQIYFFNLV